jgi:hypothetical protein
MGSISDVLKVGGHNDAEIKPYGLVLRLRDFRRIHLNFAHRQTHSRRPLYRMLKTLQIRNVVLAGPGSIPQAALFSPTAPFATSYGTELDRLLALSPTNWRITNVNQDNQLCLTYPSRFIVPACIDDITLFGCAAFRTRGRVPVLAWISSSGAALLRSSQPRSGVTNRRSPADEAYLNAVSDTTGRGLHIMDARPRRNAIANQAKGAGFEKTEFYRDCTLSFAGIENIHVMRSSHERLERLVVSHDVCRHALGSQQEFYNRLDASEWLQHISVILFSAKTIVSHLLADTHVLVHCTDGWDRTPLLVSLAKTMVDPWYRSLDGFRALVEMEWLAMGHQFTLRMGYGPPESRSQASPTFLQFLDCLHQLLIQHAAAFEFTSHYLVWFYDCMVSGYYGDFLGNSDRERQDALVTEQTRSIWTLDPPADALNSHWKDDGGVLSVPWHCHQRLSFWSDFYCRFTSDVNT